MKTKICLTLLFSVLLIPLTSVHAANFSSSYATIAEKHCTTLPRETDTHTQVCPHFKDIGIKVVRGDVRQYVVLDRDNQQYPLIFNDTSTKDAARITLGPTIEWRQKRGRVVGMIMRLNIVNNTKKRSFLVVSKVTDQTICIIGSVPPQRNQNQQARRMVDGAANKPCLNTPVAEDNVLKALVGSWVEPVPSRPQEVQGFILYENGKAESINMKTLRYQKWRVEGNRLIFTLQNVINSWGSSEDESYTFAFCDGKLCLTTGNITQVYTKQNSSTHNEKSQTDSHYNSPYDSQYDRQHRHDKRVVIGMMVGRQYADHCSFLKPLDLRNFIYKDDNSWRFIFSSNPKNRTARMLLNNRIENLELINIEENFYSKTIKERYRVRGHRSMVVTLEKTETNSFRHYKRYKGNIRVERNGLVSEIAVSGDCRL